MIHIKKNGFFVKGKDAETKSVEFIEVETLSYHLQDSVVIDEDVTVEDLVTSLNNWAIEVDLIFAGYTKGFNIGPYFDSMKLGVVGEELDDLDFLEFHWNVEYIEYDEEVDGNITPEINFMVCFSGINDSVKVSTFEESREYGLSLAPLRNWKHLPIKLDKVFTITSVNKDPKTNVYKQKKIITAERGFNFYELIGGFLYELSWHGYPDKQEEVADKLANISYEIGDMKRVSFDEIKLEGAREELADLETNKQSLVDNEKYEDIGEVDKQIEEVKAEIEGLEKKINEDK